MDGSIDRFAHGVVVAVKLLAGCVSEGNVVSVWNKRFAIREQNIKRLLGIGYVFLWKNASSRISFK
jgi:hypothetical protein